MAKHLSKVAYARLASGLTLDDAANITGMSIDEYERVERHPFMFSVGELRALCTELNEDGRVIMRTWIEYFFGL